MTRSSAITFKSMTIISPPTDNAYGQGDSLYGSSETAGTTRTRVITGLKERDRKDKTYQADGVECDWQTVFWRLPTPPHRSDNQGVPSSTKATVSSRTSDGAAKSSPSGLESLLAVDEAVTLGEKLAGEMIWGKNEYPALRFPNLYLVRLSFLIHLMLGYRGAA